MWYWHSAVITDYYRAVGSYLEVGGVGRARRAFKRSAAERVSEVCASAPIGLLQGSGGATPEKILG